jgi:NADH pyrophosphatase NudC (nudix superfamily)
MADAKVNFSIGTISFSGEGEETWVATQLDKILEKVPELVRIVPQSQNTESGVQQQRHKEASINPSEGIATKTLASFLKEKNATSNQNKKFLTTSLWLEAKGKKRVTTTDVTKALKDNNQSKLTNASEALNQNVSKGYCEKDGKEFYVTDEGKASL